MIGVLKLFQPETAHAIGKWAMKHRLRAPGRYRVVTERVQHSPGSYKVDWPTKYQLFGNSIDNPFGLAAGFDKNGELVDVIRDYGFGFMEVGSVTYRGGKGNPRPRLFRLENGGLLNRMGLNGDPAVVVADRLKEYGHAKHYGVNIAKTHDPEIIGDKAIEDIYESYKLLSHLGSYTAINISCPNTREGKTFEEPGALRELLTTLKNWRRSQDAPLVVKLSPTLADEPFAFRKLIAICEDFDIKGYVACNTLPFTHPKFGKGGRSGWMLRDYVRRVVRELNLHKGAGKTIIACGGIEDAVVAAQYNREGADLYQAYSGFVVDRLAGPRFAHRINKDFENLL